MTGQETEMSLQVMILRVLQTTTCHKQKPRRTAGLERKATPTPKNQFT